MFLEQQISILEYIFLIYIFKYKAVIFNSKNISQYFTLILLYFWSNKCRLGAEENSLKNIKNLTVQKLLTGSVYIYYGSMVVNTVW